MMRSRTAKVLEIVVVKNKEKKKTALICLICAKFYCPMFVRQMSLFTF